MAFNFLAAGLQAAPAVVGLFSGENSIFSGKGRQASREIENNFRASQNMSIGDKYYDYLKSKQSQANMGLGASTLGLMQRNAGRNTVSNLNALRGKRSLLAGSKGLYEAQQDANMDMGAMNERALLQNRDQADSALFQVAGLEQENALRKMSEAKEYWNRRRTESNEAITSNLTALGSAIGSGFTSGLGSEKDAKVSLTNRAGFDNFMKSRGTTSNILSDIKSSGLMPNLNYKSKWSGYGGTKPQ